MRSRHRLSLHDSEHRHTQGQETLRGTASAGITLEPHLRTAFEPSLGFDFSKVRIHADDHASRVTDAADARAMTVGSDVFFAPGEFEPRSADGLALIAHELTHVVQSAGGQRSSGLLSHHSDSAEQEASVAASTALLGGRASVSATPATIARKEKEEHESIFSKLAEYAKAPEDTGMREYLKSLNEGTRMDSGLGLLGPLGSALGIVGGLDKATHSDNMLGIASGATSSVGNLLGLGGWGSSELFGNKEFGGTLGGIGGLFGAGASTLDAVDDFRKGEYGKGTLDATKAAQGGLSGLAQLGGFELGAVGDLPAMAALGGEGLSGAAALGPAGAVIGAGLAGFSLGNTGLGLANNYAKKNDIFGEKRDSTEAAADAGIAVQDYLHSTWVPDIVGDIAGGATSVVGSWGTAAYSGLHAAGSAVSDFFGGPNFYEVAKQRMAHKKDG